MRVSITGPFYLLACVLACGGSTVTDATPASTPAVIRLRFVAQPRPLVAGEPFTTSVELITSSGDRATSAEEVTLTVGGGATLTGTTRMTTVNGLATFSALAVTRAGTGYTLTASSRSLSETSVAFDVVAAPPSTDRSTLAIGTPSLVPGLPAAATLSFRDRFGNVIAPSTVTLTSSIDGLTVSPSAGSTSGDGTFHTTIVAPALSTPTVTGTLTAVVSGATLAFPVTAGCIATGALSFGAAFAGVVSSNSPCTLNGHPAAVVSFHVPSSNTSAVITVTATGGPAFFPEFSVQTAPPGSVYVVGNSISAATRGPLDWLLPPGDYQVAVSSADGAAGSFSVLATNTGVGSPGCGIQSGHYPLMLIGMTATYSGQALAASDCADAATHYFDVYLVRDNRPCTISVHASYTTTLQVSNLDGAFVALANNASAPAEDTRVVLAACSSPTGPALLTISSVDPFVTGPYTFTVSFAGN
ncbi:MAG TPA: hypothetical protein VE967_17370 [Gemmatimonadaceae bacterium]|nr:hypothetical protein [Gemmatimonadaceae bacterium]